MPTNFTATANGYNPHNAHVLAQISKSTRGGSTPAGFELVRDPIECAGTTVHVLASPEAVIIAFRGTDSAYDWLVTDAWTDLESFTDFPFDYRRVHRGFRNALGAVANKIDDALKDPKATGKPRWITGHSLGGALAVLLAARQTLLQGHAVQGVYTFGQPRVGNWSFVRAIRKALDTRYFRILRVGDPTPHLPSVLRYRDCGTPFLLTQEGKLYRELSFGDRLKDGITTAKVFMNAPGVDIEKFHALTTYIDALSKYPVPA